MAFNITARTILHLGAELISSDAVALYELIKNAIDAKSTDGVDVKFEIVILPSELQSFALEARSSKEDVRILKQMLETKFVHDAPEDLARQFRDKISGAKSASELVDLAMIAYRECNKIIVSDHGHGMSEDDLTNIYLTIGTTHRADSIRDALKRNDEQPLYLGEKGVGRLSAMRLGRHLRVETATKDDGRMNILEIDWTKFEEAYDQPASSVHLKPVKGSQKPGDLISGTKIIISNLRSSWTRKSLLDIAIQQISRMADPFSWAEKRRFQIRLSYNGKPVEHTRIVAKELLANAHATCVGSYEIANGVPTLVVHFNSPLYEGQATTESFDLTDLKLMSGIEEAKQPSSFLTSIGSFDFEIYWFNRQRLRAYPGVGDREAVRGLVKAWAGICLFRDGYRVLPYGDEGDDWLGLDLEALGASGYKLNTKQLIGRVRIGRLKNPSLLDQTNRQGLVDCPEKMVMVNLLRDVISERLHRYLNEAGRALKSKAVLDFDSHQAAAHVDNLEERTRLTIKSIRKEYSGDEELLQQVKDAFKEIKDAHTRAVQRIATVEEEKERLTQLAGVGLMIEIIAHELTRATERTETTLKEVNRDNIDDETAAAFKVLSEQIRVIQRRLKILEPLSVPARQRRSHRDIAEIVDYVFESHSAQFQRHNITSMITGAKKVVAFVIEGHVVQILENLIANSIYWLDLQMREHPDFRPKITIHLLNSPPRLRLMDNGPGIPSSRAQSVFEPFYSTKPHSKSRRNGLGLYIARQNAELLGGTLELIDEGEIHNGRFNVFELELKEDAQ